MQGPAAWEAALSPVRPASKARRKHHTQHTGTDSQEAAPGWECSWKADLPATLSQEALIFYFLGECFQCSLNTNKQETRFSGVYILKELLTISRLPSLHVRMRVKYFIHTVCSGLCCFCLVHFHISRNNFERISGLKPESLMVWRNGQDSACEGIQVLFLNSVTKQSLAVSQTCDRTWEFWLTCS